MTALQEAQAFLEKWKHIQSLPAMEGEDLLAYTKDYNRLLETAASLPAWSSLAPLEREEWFETLRRIRVFLLGMGDLTGTKDFFEEVVPWLAKSGASVEQAFFMNVLVHVCRHLTMHELAEHYCGGAIEMLSAAEPGHPVLAVLHSTRGINLMTWKKWRASEEAFAEAERATRALDEGAFRPLFGLDRDAVLGSVYHNMGSALLFRLFNEEEHIGREAMRIEAHLAEQFLERAIVLYQDEGFIQRSQSNKAIAKILVGRLVDAEGILWELENHIRLLPQLEPMSATLERLRGEIARRRGHNREAIEHFRRALEKSLHSPNPDEEEFSVLSFIEAARLEAGGAAREHEGGRAARLERLRLLVEQVVPLLESKDWYTGRNHARAVAGLSVRLVQAAQQDSVQGGFFAEHMDYDRLYVAGLLHDIGKLATPWALLNKVRPLKPEEREVLERHAARGGQMLRSVGFPDLASVVEEHHERPDGKGYPAGKRELSLMSAAVALADVFEAMITPNRRWRHPKSVEEACREIELQEGAQFEARLARSLRRAIGPKIFSPPSPEGGAQTPV
jgi:HD-GYP domain-containing protein (c-di-GMP phosphodiesterase class II)